MANINAADLMRDPLQGFDMQVTVTPYGTVTTPVLQGAFTGMMCRITNHTEAYLPIGQRVPRILDGEIVVAYSLEQAWVNDKAMENTYGKPFADAYKKGRGETPIPRQQRFKIALVTKIAAGTINDESMFLSNDPGVGTDPSKVNLSINLQYARVDTGSFGVVAGRRMASSSWQGTAQYLQVV